jgi:hypothetical protein
MIDRAILKCLYELWDIQPLLKHACGTVAYTRIYDSKNKYMQKLNKKIKDYMITEVDNYLIEMNNLIKESVCEEKRKKDEIDDFTQSYVDKEKTEEKEEFPYRSF